MIMMMMTAVIVVYNVANCKNINFERGSSN